jgi:hypothetical protein
VAEDVLPPTWVVHTPSGGRHYYYRSPEPLRSAKLPDGVDLKGAGGYVVAPPSILLDDDGNLIGEYGFEVGRMPKDMGMGETPNWVLEELHGKSRDGESAKKGGSCLSGGCRRPSLRGHGTTISFLWRGRCGQRA